MSSDNSNALILQKEKEWRDLVVSKLERAEGEKIQLEKELNILKEKYSVLENDFKHNLRIIESRDNEIQEFENEIEKLMQQNRDLENQVSYVSIENDKLKHNLKTEEENVQIIKSKMRECSENFSKQIQIVQNEKNEKIRELSDVYNEKVKNLERKIICMEAEASEKNKDVLNEVEETLRQREGEMKKETSQLHSELMSYELKYRMLCRELDLVKSGKAELMADLAEKEEKLRAMERKLHEDELGHRSEISILEMKKESEAVQWKDRENKLKKAIEELTQKLNNREEGIRKRSEITKKLQTEVEGAWNTLETEKEKLVKKIESEQRKVEQLESLLEDQKQLVESKEVEMARLVNRMTEESAKKSGDLRNLKIESDEMRQNLKKKQEEILELRNELEYAIGRDLEDSKRREEEKVSWDSKLEKVRVEEMSKVENMIRTITKARDEAVAEVKELRIQLNDKKEVKLCQQCATEQTVTGHDYQLNKNMTNLTKDDIKGELTELYNQNEQLRQVIKSMSEAASKEAEIVNADKRSPTNPTIQQPVNRHIANLAERNRKLQQEKIEIIVASRKQQVRVESLESENGELKRLIREKDTEISQVRFELDSLQRHSGLDARTMRRRVQELETELAMSRKEAEEYYKGNLELGRLVEELQAEVTTLKSEQIAKVPSLNFGAQEVLIEQLKAEIKELRKRINSSIATSNDYFQFVHNEKDRDTKLDRDDIDDEVVMLKKKLKAAVNHIKNLSNEKQVLIQLSNRLRAELTKAGMKLPANQTGTTNMSRHIVERYGDDNREAVEKNKQTVQKSVGELEEKVLRLEQLHQQLQRQKLEEDEEKEVEYDGKEDYYFQPLSHREKTSNQMQKQVVDDSSTGGRKSAEEVFRLLEETDSADLSSTMTMLEANVSQPVLWAKGNRIQPSRGNSKKRNIVINRLK